MKQPVIQQKNGASPLRLVTAEQMLHDMKNAFDAVGRRAFEIFEAKGRRPGRDIEDWFQAEAELLLPVQLEISETDAAITVRAEVPGFTQKDIEVTVEPRHIMISGKQESVGHSERRSNQFYRAADLPAEVDTASSAVKGIYDRGVLTITLPKVERAKSRQIKLESK